MKQIIIASILAASASAASAQMSNTVACPSGGSTSWMPTSIKVKAPPYGMNQRYRSFTASPTWALESRKHKLNHITNVTYNSRGQPIRINPGVPEQTPMAFGVYFKNTHLDWQTPYLDGLKRNSWTSSLPNPVAEDRPGGFAIFAANAREIVVGVEYQIHGHFDFTPSKPKPLQPAVDPLMGYGHVQVLGLLGKRDPENLTTNFKIRDCDGHNPVAYWKPHDVAFPTECVLATFAYVTAELQAQIRSPFDPRPVKKQETTNPLATILPARLHDESHISGVASIGLC